MIHRIKNINFVEKVLTFSDKCEKKELTKGRTLMETKINDKGFIIFKNRNNRFNGDKNSWARLNDDGTITVCMGKGIMSDEYMEELSEFCSSHGGSFKDLHTGCRIILSR